MDDSSVAETPANRDHDGSGFRTLLNVPVPMRDGVCLSTDIYLPLIPTPVPTVAIRTGYGSNTLELAARGRYFASHGYACAIQDFRGRFDSDGDYYPYMNEGQDGFDLQEWVGVQPWSNGRIGTVGSSDLGFAQLAAAPLACRFLRCMIPQAVGGDQYSTLFYPGGAFQLSALLPWSVRTSGRVQQIDSTQRWHDIVWTLPISKCDTACGMDVRHWKDFLDHPSRDHFWEPLNLDRQWERVSAPAYFMSGWYDIAGQHVLNMFREQTARGATSIARRCKAIVGPWIHQLSCSPIVGDLDFGDESKLDLQTLELQWFDFWLKDLDNGVLDGPPLQLFVMGSNHWHGGDTWPLTGTDWQRWYLHSGGSANTLKGDGTLSPYPPADEPTDAFTYDPLCPVPTVGGAAWASPALHEMGPADQRGIEMRNDVLCYTSQPMDRDLTLIGPVSVVLYAATDCSDTDWTAKLVDVGPDGYAMILCDGILRARYRDGYDQARPLHPGRQYRYEITVGATGNCFQTGHRIRLEISSSNFPHYDRNPNTGRPIAYETNTVAARQAVSHSTDSASYVLLPCCALK
jgi:uncharacterized protein